MSQLVSDSTHRHGLAAGGQGTAPVALVTVSDSRTPVTDVNGAYLRTQIESLGHRVVAYHVVPDEPDQVRALLLELAASSARIILFNGGTGISHRDTTYDVLVRYLEKQLNGFGELFRMLSYEQWGRRRCSPARPRAFSATRSSWRCQGHRLPCVWRGRSSWRRNFSI